MTEQQLTRAEQRFYSILKYLGNENSGKPVGLIKVYIEYTGARPINDLKARNVVWAAVRRVRKKLGPRSILTDHGVGIQVNEILE